MAEFYVVRNADTEGGRLVHRNSCAQLPASDSLHYLGSFSNREAAFSIANGLYHGVTYCPACLQK